MKILNSEVKIIKKVILLIELLEFTMELDVYVFPIEAVSNWWRHFKYKNYPSARIEWAGNKTLHSLVPFGQVLVYLNDVLISDKIKALINTSFAIIQNDA